MHRPPGILAILGVVATLAASFFAKTAVAAEAAAAPASADSLGALRPIPDTAPTLTRGQLAAKFRRTVVMIDTPGRVKATGMVIGSGGIILTTADVATAEGRRCSARPKTIPTSTTPARWLADNRWSTQSRWATTRTCCENSCATS